MTRLPRRAYTSHVFAPRRRDGAPSYHVCPGDGSGAHPRLSVPPVSGSLICNPIPSITCPTCFSVTSWPLLITSVNGATCCCRSNNRRCLPSNASARKRSQNSMSNSRLVSPSALVLSGYKMRCTVCRASRLHSRRVLTATSPRLARRWSSGQSCLAHATIPGSARLNAHVMRIVRLQPVHRIANFRPVQIAEASVFVRFCPCSKPLVRNALCASPVSTYRRTNWRSTAVSTRRIASGGSVRKDILREQLLRYQRLRTDTVMCHHGLS